MTTTEGYALLPIEQLHESPLNPRKHFDAAALQELAGDLHYDLVPTERPQAIKYGAAPLNRHDFVKRLRQLREARI